MLILIKRKEAKRTETITNDIPTMATAIRWIAELGGYTGKSSGGPPGATTIGRGREARAAGVEFTGGVHQSEGACADEIVDVDLARAAARHLVGDAAHEG